MKTGERNQLRDEKEEKESETLKITSVTLNYGSHFHSVLFCSIHLISLLCLKEEEENTKSNNKSLTHKE